MMVDFTIPLSHMIEMDQSSLPLLSPRFSAPITWLSDLKCPSLAVYLSKHGNVVLTS